MPRYWDESRGQVCDEFLDTHSVGHEPADVQVDHMVGTLGSSGIHLSKMLCLSRDNPSVMQRVSKWKRRQWRSRYH